MFVDYKTCFWTDVNFLKLTNGLEILSNLIKIPDFFWRGTDKLPQKCMCKTEAKEGPWWTWKDAGNYRFTKPKVVTRSCQEVQTM